MKVFKSILVVVCMLGTLLGYASGGSDFSLVEGTKKVKVVFEDVIKGEVLIVKDENGEIFHKEVLNHSGKIYRVFDFSNLDNGNYEIDLNKGSEVLIKPFSIKNNELTFKKESKKIFHEPLIQTRENLIKISRLYTLEDDADVVLLYNDVEIYNDKLNKKSDHLSKLYKLDEYQNGKYKVIIHSEGKSYAKEFSL